MESCSKESNHTRLTLTHLPWNAAENEEHSVVEILAVILRLEGADPVDFGRGDGTHRRVGHGERNADPLMKQMLTTTTTTSHKIQKGMKVVQVQKLNFKFPARRHYQSEKDEEELDDIGVGHRVESAKERVENGDASRQDDADVDVNVHDDADGRSCPTPPQKNKG